jgi:hypothetical protein
VNPTKPWEAKLKKGIGLTALWLLFPLPFILVGVFGLWATVFGRGIKIGTTSRGKSMASLSAGVLESEPEQSEPLTAEESQPTTLKPSPSRGGSFVGSLLGALVWNGFIAFFAYVMMREHNLPLLPKLFIGLFALIGLFLLVNVPLALLKMFNATFTIDLPQAVLRRGDGFQFQWRMNRAAMAPAPTRLQLKLIAEIKKVSGSGKHRRVRREKVYEADLADTTVAWEMEQGQAGIALPTEVSQEAEWKIQVIGEVPGWPDIDDSFPLDVR